METFFVHTQNICFYIQFKNHNYVIVFEYIVFGFNVNKQVFQKTRLRIFEVLLLKYD